MSVNYENYKMYLKDPTNARSPSRLPNIESFEILANFKFVSNFQKTKDGTSESNKLIFVENYE